MSDYIVTIVAMNAWRDYQMSESNIINASNITGVRNFVMRDEIPEQYAVGKSILGDDPQLQTSMRNLLQSMMVDYKSVNKIVNIATGEKAEVCSALHALINLVRCVVLR